MAEPDSSNNYKFDLDVSAKAKEFGSKSGKYSVSLIVGDAVVSNPINWNLADISLKFPGMYTMESTVGDIHSFRGNYSFLNLEIQRSQYIRPKVTVHKGAETIQGRIETI